MDDTPAIAYHRKHKGKLSVEAKAPVETREDLNLAYTPGVAEACRVITESKEQVYDLTIKGNCVAILTDGSAVLGLGNIGAEASLPVMEGKAMLLKEFAGVDSFPIAITTQKVDEIVETVKRISPIFGGINLEDISAPRCFEVEEKLQGIGIPVFHDDQHGTAIVVLAALINACKVVGKELGDLTVVVNGVGAAGTSIINFLTCFGDPNLKICKKVKNILACDRKGIIYRGEEGLDTYKEKVAEITNKDNVQGTLADAMKGADVFIGVSAPNLVSEEMVRSMARDAIVFAMANPIPEIMPDKAKAGGARIVATGRSDFPNQVNNALAFPGLWRGLLDARAEKVANEMKLRAAYALAGTIENPTEEDILPSIFDKNVVPAISRAVKEHCRK